MKYKIDNLIPADYNPRKISKEAMDGLKKSIKRFGLVQPIVLNKKTGFIVGGHQRVAAMKELGIKECEVVEVNLSDKEEKALNVALNNNHIQGEFDKGLQELLKQIHVELPNDFFEIQLDKLATDDFWTDKSKEAIEDSIPEVTESICKLGDIWQLGEHRLMCGDSADKSQIDALLNKQKPSLLLTDPPYGIDVVKDDGNVGGNRSNGKVKFGVVGKYGKVAPCKVYKKIINDDKPFDPTNLLDIADQMIIFGANNFASKLPDNSHWIVWDKKMPQGTCFSDAELAWTNIDKKIVKTYEFTWAGMTREGNRKDELKERVHPTQKPVGLFELIINDYKPESVIDLYGGSGTTIIACEKTKRKCFMMEIDPHYCDVIIKRWEQYDSKTAVLLSKDGKANKA